MSSEDLPVGELQIHMDSLEYTRAGLRSRDSIAIELTATTRVVLVRPTLVDAVAASHGGFASGCSLPLPAFLSLFLFHGFGELARVTIRGATIHAPYVEPRIFVGHIDAETAFEVTWEWRGVHVEVDAVEKQIWTPAPRFGDSGRFFFGDRLQVDGGELFFDLPIPAKALFDSGFTHPKGGQHGFRYLRILVQKTYALGTRRGAIPPVQPLRLTVQEGPTMPNRSVRALSVEE